jgi:hypothetical protein
MPTYKFYQFCLNNKVDSRSFLSKIQTINKKKDKLVFNKSKEYPLKSSTPSKKIDVSNMEQTKEIERLTRAVKIQNELSKKFIARLNITEYEKLEIYKTFGKYDDLLDTHCYRVFTGCVEGSSFSNFLRYGGRWYCDCQGIPSKYRKKIEFSYDSGET